MSTYYNNLKNNPYVIHVEELFLTPEISKMLESYSENVYIDEAQSNIKEASYFKIIYRSNGHAVVGYLIQPHGTGPFPCVIYNRGGMGELGKINTERIFTDKYSKYATWGYITIMSQYSGTDGGEGHDELGGAEIEDCLVLKDILDNYSFADTNRIGMFGTSRGGTMTYLALSKTSWIRAAAVKAGMADRFRSFVLRPEMKERCRAFFNVDSKEEMIKRSAVYWTDAFCKTTPVLLMHGRQDKNVSFQDSVDLHNLLDKNNIASNLVIFDDGDHTLSAHQNEESALVKDWFDKYVKNYSS